MKTYVVGHKNPDTDSIVSAIGLAEFRGDAEAVKAGEINNETKLVLEKFGLSAPKDISAEEKKVILVDHNEPGQIHSNIKEEEIVSIFDHHKLGGLVTPGPITVEMRPVGSSATIVADLFFKKNKEISKEIASILICGILSDTLKYTSPTTTEEDKKIAEELNKIAELDIDLITKEMFEAKSDISDIKTEDLLSKDYKVFDMSDKKVGIGVWETVDTKTIINRKEEIINKLASLKEKDSLSLVYFAAVDILKGNSEMFILNGEEESVAKKAFSKDVVESIMSLPGVVSRKKQIIPMIEGVLK